MRRIPWALLAGLLILACGTGRAADAGPAGNWKMSLFVQGKMQLLWLVRLESADGKLTAKVLDQKAGAPKAAIADPRVADGKLRFTITLEGTAFQFEGELPKQDATVLTGNI